MVRVSIALVALGLLAGCASAAPTVWGKAGVSHPVYQLDNAECALIASGQLVAPSGDRNIAGPAPNAAAAQNATNAAGARANPSTMSGSPAAQAAEADANQAALAQRAQQMRERRARAEAETACLQSRGYRQFRLTAEQAEHFNDLPRSGTARSEYLHSLGADQAVLDAQAL